MNDIAVLVTQDLHFYVFGILEIFLDEYIINAKSFGSFRSGRSELRKQLLFGSNDPHTSATASCCGFKDNGITAYGREVPRLLLSLDSFLDSRYCGNSNGLSNQFGLDLIPQFVHHL